MNLSTEDELRLNIMLVSARAVRIDESRLTVWGLVDGGDLSLQLNPSGPGDAYLRAVRGYLSTRVLGSPKHFPTHLRRWAGLGQFHNAPLEKLLLLGDPEAAFAVACSPNLTERLAKSAWWAAQEPTIARALLRNAAVASSPLGRELAVWLFDFLPFEEDADALFEAVCLLLRSGVLDSERRRRIWEKGRRTKLYRAAFLVVCPDQIPAEISPRSISPNLRRDLDSAAGAGSDYAAILQRALEPAVRAFLVTCYEVLAHANQQAEVSAVFQALDTFFAIPQSSDWLAPPAEWVAALDALTVLAGVRERDLTSVFARSDAIGSVMRAQTDSIRFPVLNALDTLVGREH